MTVEIKLSQGQIAIVDDVDSDLGDVRWFARLKRNYSGGGKYLAQRRIKGKHYVIHRVVMERVAGRALSADEFVDHINGDPLDNRRQNLRIVNREQNARNRNPASCNTSGVMGVHFSNVHQKWIARISFKGKRRALGYYDTFEEAKAVRIRAELALWGEYSALLSRSHE